MDFERIYSTYYMQVYSYMITLAKDRDLAEEITQHAFFKAMAADAEFRGRANELTWLCAIARNLFYDEMRKRKHTAELPPEDEPTSEEDVGRQISDEDTAYRIHAVLHTMEEPYKEVFQLRVFGELSFQKIALLFGKTETWARVTYHRARLKIQERME